TLARLYDEASEIALFGSHAPKDVAFRDRLMRAAIGKWTVDMGGMHKEFRVTYANTFDEPVGGLMNVLLTDDGLHYQRNDVRDGDTLVIDIGGFTTDWLAVRPGGEVDYGLHESVTMGIQNVVKDFERSFRANNLDATQAIPDLPPARVREAIVTGVYRGGGRQYPCQREVEEATNILLSQIADTYQNVAHGPLPWDTIILTGGGSALLFDRLLPILNHERVLLSERKSNENHLANVRGGMKLWKLYKEHSLL
ncbi:MAG TPA: hypothetical protein VJZ27_20650, partial [Aggregatilineales bacterium]|nr:hypothetical protein [Aggregatilineales bacterium]